MFATENRSIARWIDDAQAMCQPPTGKALAAELGLTEPSLSQVKKGQRKLTKDQVQRLAEMLEIDPVSLWAQQAAEEWVRARGQRGMADLVAVLVTFIAAVLLAGASGLSSSQLTKNHDKSRVDALHIVAMLRQMTMRASRTLKRLLPGPMALGC